MDGTLGMAQSTTFEKVPMTCLAPFLSSRLLSPGPPVVPFLGSIPWLARADPAAQKYPYRAMHRLSQRHGQVMRVALGGEQWWEPVGPDWGWGTS